MSDIGKSAIVTGGGSGMGAGTARKLVQNGWSVTVFGRTRSSIESVLADIALAVLAVIACLAWGGSALADPGADPRGVWLTPGGKSHVEIAPCGDKLCGRIVWLKEPNNEQGQPKRDAENRDESLRARPILGLPLLTGFPHEPEDGVWDDGDIYNPEDGKTYSSELEMNDKDTLKVSGCVWIFCQSQIWKRVK